MTLIDQNTWLQGDLLAQMATSDAGNARQMLAKSVLGPGEKDLKADGRRAKEGRGLEG